MKSKYNIIRKKVELLRQFKSCQTEKQLVDLNNSIVLPLYEKTKELVKNREESKDFGEVTENEFYLSDFNFLYDCEYFLNSLHSDIQDKLSDLHFQKCGWTSINF